MYLHVLKTSILKFQQKHQISYSFKQVKRLMVNYLKQQQQQQQKTTTTNNNNKNNNNRKKRGKKKSSKKLTIRVDYGRINGRYSNAEYRGKITRCGLTLTTGPYAGLIISKSCRFSPETEFIPLILASTSAPPPFVKPLNSHPPFQKSHGPEIISSFKIWT